MSPRPHIGESSPPRTLLMWGNGSLDPCPGDVGMWPPPWGTRPCETLHFIYDLSP